MDFFDFDERILQLFVIGIDLAIWMLAMIVQRIIYPAFEYISESSFHLWHNDYMARIGQLVAPFMFMQLLSGFYLMWIEPTNLMHWIALIFVLITWIDTFLRAVPLHNKLQDASDHMKVKEFASKLVLVNKVRTVFWTLIPIIHFYTFLE